MTIQEAYIKAKKLSDKKILDCCLDLGDCWAFRFRCALLYKDTPLYGGIHWYAIHKSTGEIMTISSTPRDQQFLSSGTLADISHLKGHLSKTEAIFYEIFNK